MINLVLSLDYEIFGNGSGDVRRDMIEPTRRLLTLCDRYGAKVTIFFEVVEYWAMKKAEGQGLQNLGYSSSREIEDQLRSAVQSGHDVQLHLHPWWVGAEFEAGRWRLNPQYKQITDLPHGLGSEGDIFSIAGVLSQGKRTLEAMIKPGCPDYSCLVYRAAMFWGQPSEILIAGLKHAGFLADSSVVKGLYEKTPVYTDYRRAESLMGYWWTRANDISRSGPKGEHIIEFPVYCKMRPYVWNFKWSKLSTTLKRRSVEKANTHGHGMMTSRNSTESSRGIMRKLLTLQPMKFDYCKLSAGDMIRWLRHSIKNTPECKDSLGLPMVILGHSKDFWNDRNLEMFLEFIQNECKEKVRFSTLGELTKRIITKDNVQGFSADPKTLHLSHKS